MSARKPKRRTVMTLVDQAEFAELIRVGAQMAQPPRPRGASSMSDWIPCAERLPERGVVVLTKTDDANGPRNEQPLKRDGAPGSRLWFFPDGGMYVYYQVTHWRPME